MYQTYTWSRKEYFAAALAAAAWLALAVCYYRLYTAYDGAVRSNAAYFLTYSGVQTVCASLSITPKEPDRSSVLYRLTSLFFICIAAAGVGLVVHEPAYLSPVNLLMFQLYGALIILVMILLYGRWKRRAAALNSLSRRLLFSAGSCLYIMATICAYLLLFQPLPLREAETVGAAYGMDYIGRLTGGREKHPLGVYWFSDHERHANPEEYTYLYIDVLTHEIVPEP